MKRHVMMLAMTAFAALLAVGCQSGGGAGPALAKKTPPVVYGQTARPVTPLFTPTTGAMTPIVDQEEVLQMDEFLNPQRWGPSEATVSASEMIVDGKPALHFHIPVDYYAGEEKYPIGWPRMYFTLKTPEKVFAQYDRFEFKIYAMMSREDVPASALNVALYSDSRTPNATIKFGKEVPLPLGQWTQVSKPISEIKSPEQLEKIGVNISERDYRHGDKLDFHFADFRLVRSSFCRVSAMTAQSAVLFADTGVIPVEIVVEGPASDAARGIPFELSQGGKSLRLETLPARRGPQRLDIDVAELRLAPGEYQLTAFPANPERRVSVPIKVISSPWEASK